MIAVSTSPASNQAGQKRLRRSQSRLEFYESTAGRTATSLMTIEMRAALELRALRVPLDASPDFLSFPRETDEEAIRESSNARCILGREESAAVRNLRGGLTTMKRSESGVLLVTVR